MRFSRGLSGLVLLGLVIMAWPASAQESYEVTVTRNIAYVEDGNPRQVLDLYLPQGIENFPVLMFVSGGGWSQGEKDWVRVIGQVFAPQGIGVVTVQHRLAPQVTMAEQAGDLALAFAWIKANIAEYGGDPEQVMVGGHSAGGHLTALMVADSQYLEAVGYTASDVAGVISLSGALDVRTRFGEELSPTSYLHEGLPPFLLLVAEDDLTGFEQASLQVQTELTALEVPVSYSLIPNTDHYNVITNVATHQQMLEWMTAIIADTSIK